MEIISLKPTLKDTIWGGTRLMREFGFETERDNIAEAWLLSAHPDGPSYVENGKYAGQTLAQVLENEGFGILGRKNADKPGFPIFKYFGNGSFTEVQTPFPLFIPKGRNLFQV